MSVPVFVDPPEAWPHHAQDVFVGQFGPGFICLLSFLPRKRRRVGCTSLFVCAISFSIPHGAF